MGIPSLPPTLPLCVLAVLVAVACAPGNPGAVKNKALNRQQEQAAQTFFLADSILKPDNGRFWGRPLYGPLLIIDPATREFSANQNNRKQGFIKIGTIYSDTLPQDINIANTAIEWDSIRWSMVMLPLPEDPQERAHLVIHELFHRIQPEIGFNNLQEQDNAHLDTYDGRVLLELELNALKEALKAADSNSRSVHLTRALTFRKIRQANPKIKEAENSLEINEGLAEYTALLLSGRKDAEVKSHLISSVPEFFANPTFVRSFAYQTIPIYGYLLSLRYPAWQHKINADTNLTDFFLRTLGIVLPSNPSLAGMNLGDTYDYGAILQQEMLRERKRLETIAYYKTLFLKSPTLTLNFENMNVSFDPRNIIPLDTLGTVYPNLRITDNFGVLTVEKGALMSLDWSHLTVSEPENIQDTLVTGSGWKLELDKAWRVVKDKDSYTLRKNSKP